MATIDRARYPHLFDSILGFFFFDSPTYSSHLAIRATCRDLRDRVDEILVKHVGVFPSDPKRAYVTYGRNDNCAPATDADDLGLVNVKALFDGKYRPIPRRDWLQTPRLAELTEVMDICTLRQSQPARQWEDDRRRYCGQMPPFITDALLRRLLHVTVVRDWGGGRYRNGPCVISFQNRDPASLCRRSAVDIVVEKYGKLPTCDEDFPDFGNWFLCPSVGCPRTLNSHFLESVTFHLSSSPPTSPTGTPTSRAIYRATRERLLEVELYQQLIMYVSTRTKSIVVGFTRWVEDSDHQSGGLYSHITAGMTRYASTTRWGVAPHDIERWVSQNLILMSDEEYRAFVGEKAYALQQRREIPP